MRGGRRPREVYRVGDGEGEHEETVFTEPPRRRLPRLVGVSSIAAAVGFVAVLALHGLERGVGGRPRLPATASGATGPHSPASSVAPPKRARQPRVRRRHRPRSATHSVPKPPDAAPERLPAIVEAATAPAAASAAGARGSERTLSHPDPEFGFER